MAIETSKGIIGKPVPRPQRPPSTQAFIPEILKGMKVTMKHFFRNTK